MDARPSLSDLPPGTEAAIYESAMSLAERVKNATHHEYTVETSFATVLVAQAQEDSVQAVLAEALRIMVYKNRQERTKVVQSLKQHSFCIAAMAEDLLDMVLMYSALGTPDGQGWSRSVSRSTRRSFGRLRLRSSPSVD